jgi:hypothetical protein
MPMATASTERTRLTRRNVLRCALVAPAVVAGARRASAADPVSVGMVNTISDAGFFVAEAKGYFKAAGIDVKFSPFPSASGMIAPLASGDLDVGSGAVSAGHYNANERQIPVKFVADKARNAPDLSFQSIVVRSALIESGKFKGFADLKGLKFAIPAPASVGETVDPERSAQARRPRLERLRARISRHQRAGRRIPQRRARRQHHLGAAHFDHGEAGAHHPICDCG